MKKTRIHHSVKKEDLGTPFLYNFSPSNSFLTHLEGENIPANRYEDEEAE